MRAVQVASDRSLVVVEALVPSPSAGQVLLDVAYCGICGSDLHFRDVPALFPAGTVPGHEVAGHIVEVGDGVAGWSVDDRVCVLPFAQCGRCTYCLGGNEQVCTEGDRQRRRTRHGAAGRICGADARRRVDAVCAPRHGR